MKSTAIKQGMHHAIEVIEDKEFLKAVYVILNEKSKEYDFELNEEERTELDALKRQYKEGKSKSYSVAEVRENALKAIKK